MDLSPPSILEQDDAPSNMDAPSAPTQKMAGFVSDITPRNMRSCFMACVGRFLRTLQVIACLNRLLQRVGSNRAAGASAKAPDSGDQRSATQAPGAEQVEHTSSGASESGEVKDAPRLQSHVVELFSPGSDVTAAALSSKSWNLVQRRLCWVWLLFFVHAGLSQIEFFQLGLDA